MKGSREVADIYRLLTGMWLIFGATVSIYVLSNLAGKPQQTIDRYNQEPTASIYKMQIRDKIIERQENDFFLALATLATAYIGGAYYLNRREKKARDEC